MSAYWHKLETWEQQKIYDEGAITIGEFMEEYEQPPWCSYPDSLEGLMGCWSLIMAGKIKEVGDCKGCDCLTPQGMEEES